MYDPYAAFSKYTLSNGLEVHLATWDRPWVRLEAVVHSGAREEPVNLPGLAHFVEHCVVENIPDWTHNQAERFFKSVGGGADFGNTGYLSTQSSFAVPADIPTFREAISIFGSMLLESCLEKNIENQRKIIHCEFHNRYPFQEKLEWILEIRRSLFKGHRLETYNRTIGRPEGFLSATKVDLQDFYDQHYTPANMSLVVVGGLTAEEILAELERSPFGMKKEGRRSLIPPAFGQFATMTEKSKTVKFSDYLNFKIDQTAYDATWAFPSDFPLQARRVFSRILDEILFDEIRNKRELTYSIHTSYEDLQDVVEYSINGHVNPSSTLYINELVQKCIAMVPSRRDLYDWNLEMCIKMCLMVDLSGSDLRGKCADELSQHHRIISMQEVWDDLHKVTFKQMEEATQLLSPERQYTFITHP